MKEIKPEYEKKVKQLKHEKGIAFRNITELRTKIEEIN